MTCWRYYNLQLVWEHLGISPDKLEEVAGEREVTQPWLSGKRCMDEWMDRWMGGWRDGWMLASLQRICLNLPPVTLVRPPTMRERDQQAMFLFPDHHS